MANPLVSIIVPIYNVEHYIHRAINSLLHQTYPFLDIILIDDGSPDKCPQICDEYARKDNRIRVIHKKNGGLSDARNVGLNLVRGEYLTFVDSDDYISPDTIEKFLKIIHEENVDVVCCGLNIINDKEVIYDHRAGNTSFKINGKTAVKLLLEDVFPYNFAPAKLYKQKLFEGIRFPVGRIYEDLATTYLVLNKAEKVYCMKECLYYYERGREGNITSELNSTKAVWSYYCGCLNSKERINFCQSFPDYTEMLPAQTKTFYSWSKLCIEAATKLGKNEYKTYCKKIRSIFHEIKAPMPLKIRVFIKFSNLYYYLYPILKWKNF